MSVTDVDICNLALARLGATAITTIGEATVNGELCDRFYSNTYDKTLRSQKWRCALKRASLAQTTAPLFEWDFAYSLPSDCLRVLRMERQDYVFTVEGRELLTDQDTGNIVYISRTLTGNLDPLCVQAIYINLAIELSHAITGSRDMSKVLHEELWQIILPEATKANMIENLESDIDKVKSGWADARIERGSGLPFLGKFSV